MSNAWCNTDLISARPAQQGGTTSKQSTNFFVNYLTTLDPLGREESCVTLARDVNHPKE